MKLKLLIGVICLLCISCEVVQYDGETRFVTRGKVLNDAGLPLANIDVTITNSASKNSNNSVFYVSSIAKTNSNGEFVCITPKAINTLQTTLSVNENSANGLSSQIFYNIQEIDYLDYKIEVNPIILRPNNENVRVNVTFIKSFNSNFDIQKYQLIQEFQSSIVYNNPFLSLYNDLDNTNMNDFIYSNFYTVRKNQSIILKYTKINVLTNETEIIEMPITILENQENVTIFL